MVGFYDPAELLKSKPSDTYRNVFDAEVELADVLDSIESVAIHLALPRFNKRY